MSGNDRKKDMTQERASAINSSNVSARANSGEMFHANFVKDRSGKDTGKGSFPARANAAAAKNANAAANEIKQK